MNHPARQTVFLEFTAWQLASNVVSGSLVSIMLVKQVKSSVCIWGEMQEMSRASVCTAGTNAWFFASLDR